MDDLRLLAHDLSEAPRRAQRAAVAVVEHAAVNVKNGWRANAKKSGGHHARMYPSTISYEMGALSALVGVVEAEVGPDKNKPQGALGNLLEFGSVNNPPKNDGGRALRDEAPKFETELAKVTLDSLGWH